MNEKGSEEIIDGTRDEKAAQEDVKQEIAGEGRRRKSVALNIVENPLKVSIWLCILVFLDMDANFLPL
jgi:hypothetical protein